MHQYKGLWRDYYSLHTYIIHTPHNVHASSAPCPLIVKVRHTNDIVTLHSEHIRHDLHARIYASP